jgi:integrase
MSGGTTFKQCGCRGTGTGKPLGRKCPKLRRGNRWSPVHGTWYYQLELPPHGDGTRRPPLRHGGFTTKVGAEAELSLARELLAIAAPDDPGTAIRIADAITATFKATHALPDPAQVRKQIGGGHDPAVKPPAVGEWLDGWLAAKKGLRPGTVRSYAGHIRLYLKPHLGHIGIDKLRVTDLASVFDHIEELNDAITEARASGDPARRAAVKGRRRIGPATCQRIRATARSAIGTYMKQHPGVLPANVASLVELPPGTRPKALVWTEERVRAWQRDFDTALAAARAAGGRVSPVDIWISVPRPSPVMVWTRAQTMVFLATARRHRLHALWRLITTRGLRRGEGCGLRRLDTDLDAALTTIRWQITQLGWDPVQGAPKSDAGERTIALDADTIADIGDWRREQDQETEAAGDAWTDSGFEFTDEHGNPLHPAAVTDAFHLIAYLAGLPPIRLHDLRHGAATLLLAAGHDMKVVQETLGLSSITIAADTYTSVLPQLARRSAEDVAALIRPPGSTSRERPRNKGRSRSTGATASSTASARPAARTGPDQTRPSLVALPEAGKMSDGRDTLTGVQAAMARFVG